MSEKFEYENTNPHHVFDGGWGGWGPPIWFRARALGFGERDVLERKTDARCWPGDPKPTDYRWVRLWDDAAQKWRELTAEDREKLKNFPADR